MTVTILENKRVLLGVTGSIAAYKAVDLASKLTQGGALVDAVLTPAARQFVTPLSFLSVTGRPAYDDMWNLDDHVRHVRLGETADLLVVAPASAHTIAKLTLGLADNLLTVTALAARCPLVVAPAMDGGMYEHPATQHNLAVLAERGVTIVGPASGRMASGLIGAGRLVEPVELLGHIRVALGRNGALRGRQVVVTAGPTREPIDPVRYLSNYSTGKQGVALAQAALDAGARVTLIAGPLSQVDLPSGATFVAVESARQMCEAVLAAVKEADALLMAAAVADFRPNTVAEEKLKKTELGEASTIELTRNPDILAAVQEQKGRVGRPLVTLGFAAETRDVVAYGREKLARKGLDFIAVNDVSAGDAGFAVDTNRIILLDSAGNAVEMPLQSKAAVAEYIVRRVAVALDGAPAAELAPP
jgi:phosphopantothenoylcysteine decarboxylase/phosphopantothenate--cysteine ligase